MCPAGETDTLRKELQHMYFLKKPLYVCKTGILTTAVFVITKN